LNTTFGTNDQSLRKHVNLMRSAIIAPANDFETEEN
jgi:hypothetical protein